MKFLSIIIIVNTLFFAGAITAKVIQHHQVDLNAGISGDISVWMIVGCTLTWIVGTVCIIKMSYDGIKFPAIVYVWWIITGVPVVLVQVGLLLFLLPAFL